MVSNSDDLNHRTDGILAIKEPRGIGVYESRVDIT